MENKPLHYDGSIQKNETGTTEAISEPFQLTDEMRENISGNPYENENNE
ncbi:hypothetical protein [Halalkalibacter flavus]